jgi:glycerol transport system ATP-binding protein
MALIDGARIELDEKTAISGNNAQGELELGIRPIHLEVQSHAVDGGLPAKVKTVEDQGSFKIVTVNLSGHTLRARLPEGQRVPESEVWLRFPPQWTRLFADGRLVE